LTRQTDLAEGGEYFPRRPPGARLGQEENSGAMGWPKTLSGPARVPLSTQLTAKLSMQQVTAVSKAAQAPARLVVERMEAEASEAVAVALTAAAVEGSMVAVEGVNRFRMNGGKSGVSI